MRALKRIGMKFARLPADRQLLLLLEALLYLGWARVLKALPFPRIAPSLGEPLHETPHAHRSAEGRQVREISQAVRAMSRYTPWQSRCLVQAIAAQRMLARRRIASTLYLGTAKDRHGRMIAHAWLRSGPCYVTGAEERRWFTTVAVFGKLGGAATSAKSSGWEGAGR